jgi:hypothetical protein
MISDGHHDGTAEVKQLITNLHIAHNGQLMRISVLILFKEFTDG